MKLGIIISTKKAETNWNALRLANFAIKQGDEVKVFLLGEGVEYEEENSEKFDIRTQVEELLRSDKVEMLACGTCLKSRNQEGSEVCPMSTMKDLYNLVNECDKVLTF